MNLMKLISKKISIILLCILSITTISGCNNSKYTSEYDISNENTSTTNTLTINTSTTNYTFDNNQGQYYMTNSSAAAENGYYYITHNGSTNGSEPIYSYFLYYYDMTSQTAVPLCSKLECKHNDSNCDAFLTENECLGQMIWYYNGKLFMIERTDENDCLVSYDKEGRNKEKVCILSDGVAAVGFKKSLQNVACVNKGYLYYEVYNSENDYVNVKRVELKSDSKPQEIGTVPVNPNVTYSTHTFRFYPIQDKVYICEEQYISDSDITDSVYKFDINENNLTSVVEFKYKDISNSYRGDIYNLYSNMTIDNDGNIYYLTEFDGEKLPASMGSGYNRTYILNKYDVLTKKNSELYVLEGIGDKICLRDAIVLNGYDGKYIYFYEVQYDSSLLKELKSCILEESNNLVVMNTDGSIVDKIHFTINSDLLDKISEKWRYGGIKMSKIIPGDDRYIMLATTDLAVQGIEHSYEYIKKHSSPKRLETEVLAVLDKKQIGTDTHTWIKIKKE